MGATSYVQILSGPTLDTAYAAEVEQCRYEHGSSYTGTIAEASGIRLVRTTPMLEYDALQEGQRLITTGQAQKWEDALAIPIAEPLSTRTIKVTVDVTGLDYEARQVLFGEAVRAKLKTGEGIVSLEVVPGTKKTRVVTDVPKTEAVRRFVIRDQWKRDVAAYNSQAEARKNAELLAAKDDFRSENLSVFGVIVREDGGPLLTVTRKTMKETIIVTAVVGVVGHAQNRWAVAGVYSE